MYAKFVFKNPEECTHCPFYYDTISCKLYDNLGPEAWPEFKDEFGANKDLEYSGPDIVMRRPLSCIERWGK